MTGTIQIKTMRNKKKMLYIQLSYKDAVTGAWKTKHIPTGLTDKGNKKKAKAMIPQMIEKYSYLEKSLQLVDHSLDRDILFCDYLDYWLEQKRSSIRQITFEAYTAKIAAIKKYFQNSNFKLVDMTTYALNKYLLYELDYGKINQKTKQAEGLFIMFSIIKFIYNK